MHMLVCSLRLNNLPTRFLDSIRHYMSNTTLGRLFLFNGLFDEELIFRVNEYVSFYNSLAICFGFVHGCSTLNVVTLAGDEAANGNESSWSMDCSTVVRVKTLHISSPILAAKSPFFYKVGL